MTCALGKFHSVCRNKDNAGCLNVLLFIKTFKEFDFFSLVFLCADELSFISYCLHDSLRNLNVSIKCLSVLYLPQIKQYFTEPVLPQDYMYALCI